VQARVCRPGYAGEDVQVKMAGEGVQVGRVQERCAGEGCANEGVQ